MDYDYTEQVETSKSDMDKSCAACSLKEHCLQTEEGCYTSRQRWKALLLAFLLPFGILVGGIIGLSQTQWSESVIAGIILGLIGVYYLVLWWCKPQV